jgi:hypothetical protein
MIVGGDNWLLEYHSSNPLAMRFYNISKPYNGNDDLVIDCFIDDEEEEEANISDTAQIDGTL